jgi:glucose-1-phosphate thymidylyltransferase
MKDVSRTVAVLLCAGFATRMYPLTRDFPKPLLPVAGRPVLDYLVDQILGLPQIGALHVITNARYADRFKAWAQRRLRRSWRPSVPIEIHDDGATAAENRLGACRDLRLAFHRTGRAAAYLVSAGDNIFLFRIANAWRRFLRGHRHCLVALAENDPETLKNTGVPLFGERDRVMGLLEKPDNPPPGWFCPPLYFLWPSARVVLEDFLRSTAQADAPGHFIDYLCRREPVTAIRLEEKRLDIGDLKGYYRAERMLRGGPMRV